MVLKEFRICMPMTVNEYQRGQLYMISRHSDEQSDDGEGIEVVKNEPYFDEEYGNGRYTEKKIHLNNVLGFPDLKFLLKLVMKTTMVAIMTARNLKSMHDRVSESEFSRRDVTFLDIAYDKIPEKHYKESEDCTKFRSSKTGRGPLKSDWMETQNPIMCSYKLVHVKFEVWGMQTRVEGYILKVVRDILLLGHRQAFAWIDTWYDMSFDSIRDFESKIQSATNKKVLAAETNSSPKGSTEEQSLASKQSTHSTSSSRNSSNSDLS